MPEYFSPPALRKVHLKTKPESWSTVNDKKETWREGGEKNKTKKKK